MTQKLHSITQSANLTERITELHNGILDRLQQSLEDAITIGELLTQQKESLPHGEFTPWIKKALPFSPRTARNYIKLHGHRDQLQASNVKTLTDAYALLRESKTETVSDLKADTALDLLPDGLMSRMPGLAKGWWDQRAKFTVLLDALNLDAQEIAAVLQVPQVQITSILDPQPHVFKGGQGPPPGWERAVQAEIADLKSQAYQAAARKVKGSLAQQLVSLQHHYEKKRDRLRWWKGLYPGHDSAFADIDHFQPAVYTLLMEVVRAAVGIDTDRDFSANWLLNIVDIKQDIEQYADLCQSHPDLAQSIWQGEMTIAEAYQQTAN